MIRVLIADDEPLITAGIRTVLTSAADIEVVAEAGDGRDAVEQAVRHRPDVALLDVVMPVLDGLGAVAELRGKAPSTRCVVLTAFGAEPHVMAALQHGAAGFVLKNCEPGELIRAVRAAHAGDAFLSPQVTRLLLDTVGAERVARRQEAVQRLTRLTTRESQVLALVAEGLSNAQIARRLHMTEMTIKTYVSRVLAKLDCANRVQAALLCRDAHPGAPG
ncbi:response regulator [Streptomyces sp. NPDC127068]|uniref:response regulator n=1 Tax=Streptomyces sp. NPDC127068 TaxID=3347127 RepID=UPI003654BF7F